MEHVVCNFCHSTQAEILFTGRDKLHDTHGLYSLSRCLDCGLLYLTPRPRRQEIGDYYPAEYVSYKTSILHEWFPLAGRYLRRRLMDRRCRQILRFQTCGRLLDVGCATGAFLEQMREYPQWELYGVEPDRRAATHAQERLGVEIFHGSTEEARYPDNYFDVVTLWEVFEHLHDPMGALRELNRILQRRRPLILSVPNVHSLEARCFGQYWIGYDMPRHLHAYPLPTLQRMLANTGFEVVDIRCFEGGYFTFALSMWQLTREKASSRIVRGICHRILFLQGMRFLLWPLTALARRIGGGSIATVFAVKRANVR